MSRNRRHDAILAVSITIGVVFGVTLLLVVKRVAENTTKANTAATLALHTAATLARDRAEDEIEEHATNYRICTRVVEGRAALIVHIGRADGLLPFLPLVDCRPDLTGGEARNLSHAEALAYLRRFDHHAALAP
jgi:hypothetical protein